MLVHVRRLRTAATTTCSVVESRSTTIEILAVPTSALEAGSGRIETSQEDNRLPRTTRAADNPTGIDRMVPPTTVNNAPCPLVRAEDRILHVADEEVVAATATTTATAVDAGANKNRIDRCPARVKKRGISSDSEKEKSVRHSRFPLPPLSLHCKCIFYGVCQSSLTLASDV